MEGYSIGRIDTGRKEGNIKGHKQGSFQVGRNYGRREAGQEVWKKKGNIQEVKEILEDRK